MSWRVVEALCWLTHRASGRAAGISTVSSSSSVWMGWPRLGRNVSWGTEMGRHIHGVTRARGRGTATKGVHAKGQRRQAALQWVGGSKGEAGPTSAKRCSRSLGTAHRPAMRAWRACSSRIRPRPTGIGHHVAEALHGIDRARGPASDCNPATARTRRP
jgi:hypothetical protein